MSDKQYLCIDLKSFFASVECVERQLDPMTTDLVVADPARERGTICLAVSPSLKAKGVKNRCRVFQIPQGMQYIMAEPRMQLYIDYSARIYGIYLKYISKEDIHVYSIDEAFLDVTNYLSFYHMTAKELGIRIMADIKSTLGITATCGVGTNLYLTKIALDITAKHTRDHIGVLDETIYRQTLWHHRPLTDFWRIGPGIARRLQNVGLMDMYDIAHADSDYLYKLFGIDAEYLIDHAWGIEPTTIADIKNYRSSSHSLSSGQVLMHDYNYEDALLIVKEMTDLLCLDLVDQGLVTNNLSLYIGYTRDAASCSRGSVTMPVTTNSVTVIMEHMVTLYHQITSTTIPVRRLNLSFNNVLDESYEQYDLFTDPKEMERDRNIQHAVLDIKSKYGPGAIMKGMNLLDAGTTRERIHQIGGHKSGT